MNVNEIKKLKVARVKVQKSLLFSTRYFFKKRFNRKFVVNEHHVTITDALERVIKGEITRLIINIAPRYSKTEIAVKNMIAHCLSLNNSAKFIHLSYSDDLALDNSEDIKDMIQSDSYQELFPEVQLKKDSKSKKKWYTTGGGGVYATSASGQVTGFGAGKVDEEQEEEDIKEFLYDIEQKEGFGGAIIIDDPIKPDDADSETQRDKVNNKFDSTIRNRVNSRKTPIIVIMQRVHDNDLSGYLINQEPEDWTVISLPCITTKDGKEVPLWEFKHTLDELYKLKKANSVAFERQYMQNPMPLEGLLFPASKLNRFKLSEFNHENVVGKLGFIDTADLGDDFYCYGLGDIIENDDKYYVYIRKVIFTKDSFSVTEPRTVALTNDEKPEYLYLETNKEGSLYYNNLVRQCPKTKVIGMVSKGKKETRIFMQSDYIIENFHFLVDEDQNDEYKAFFSNLTTYLKEGKNKHDDAPDDMAGLAKAVRLRFNK
jgi:predicted phage terminase large subunit-like protein